MATLDHHIAMHRKDGCPSERSVRKWVITEVEQKCRGFLWKGWEEVNGGHWLVAWKEPNEAELDNMARSLMYIHVGDDALMDFWEDPWLTGIPLKMKWPELLFHSQETPDSEARFTQPHMDQTLQGTPFRR
uniref:Reverse transcriptase zinc-binding domain-containing protein n=1 Tax=Oryza brachyantha TaxID=4533 RepID=J3L095_ORYBR